MKEFFIKSILNFLFGLKADQWTTAIQWVRQLAARPNLTNAQRADEFLAYFATYFPSFKPWVIETLRNLAVGYARKKGWIPK